MRAGLETADVERAGGHNRPRVCQQQLVIDPNLQLIGFFIRGQGKIEAA